MPPSVAPGIPVSYLDASAPWAAALGAGTGARLQAAAITRVRLKYDDATADLSHDEEYEAVLWPLTSFPDVSAFTPVDYDDRDLVPEPPNAALYRLPPPEVSSKAWWNALRKAVTDHLVGSRTVSIQANRELKLYSRIGESAEAFAARCADVAADRADAAVAALRSKYESRLRARRTRADSAAGAAARAAATHEAQHGAGAQVTTLLDGLFGGRRSRTSIVTEARRAAASAARVEAARDKAAVAEQEILDVEEDLRSEVTALDAEWAGKAAAITTMQIPLERSDVSVADLRLLWIPYDA